MSPRVPLVYASAIALAIGAATLLALAPVTGAPKEALADTTRAEIARGNIAAESVVPGAEVLLTDSLHLLRGKRVGLITNHTGRSREGTSTIDLLFHAPGVRLTAIFAPEHGIRGQAPDGAHIPTTRDSVTGLPSYSLDGETRVPTPAVLREVDVLVYDIQDVGARPYTYVWTMALAADTAKKPFIVLDRPNPARADRFEGGVLEPRFRSFTGQYPVALRYGLTPGELLRYLVGTKQVRADVTVIPMRNYRRAMWWEDTGMPWVNPSPNLRNTDASVLYTGMVFIEATNLSEGRGTDIPLTVAGAPWLTDAGAIARELNERRIPGVRFDSVTRSVSAGMRKFPGQTIPMVRVTVTDRDVLNAPEVGAHLLQAIRRRHPTQFQWRGNGIELLSGSRALREAVEGRGSLAAVFERWRTESARFEAETRPYWLYE